ncbi:hypothetical protein G7Z17_g6246 [Cylindrodendrum hubeiense]|uniref:2OG-Fe dioxygenase-domain-containing protein n=1 Tax=Cylindrodendrum hubeiense TaxID=595255 RepID=A0A9P5HFK0_9HYPO|nr:hypothetical protein G7Z17_g6246 [Cylindrodendrum hubeiense]
MFSVPTRRASVACAGALRSPSMAIAGHFARRQYNASSKVQAAEAVAHAPVSDAAHNAFYAAQHHHQQQQRPQLDIAARQQEPQLYQAIATIMKIRKRYLQERFVFTESAEMVPLLAQLGATQEDFARLQEVSDHLYKDPTLPFRRSRNGRFCFDMEARKLRRLEFQPFALSLEEDFKRHDSGQVRVFDEVEDELQLNTAFQALMVFKAAIIHGVETVFRDKLNYNTKNWVCTLFSLRTVTTPEILGEPALEGVHSDGVDHTMTTYLGSNNMQAKSAVTYMHEMAETTGVSVDDTKTTLIRARAHHRNFLDTLIVVDHEYKHSLSPVYAIDPTREATRDMLIFFTRKPVVDGHISSAMDSLKPHEELPMEIPIFAPDVLSSGFDPIR